MMSSKTLDDKEIYATASNNSSENITLSDWYHGNITKNESEKRLLQCGIEGTLLLRTEQSKSLNRRRYCISWLSPIHHAVMHCPITLVCGAYFMFGRSYTSLKDLIDDFINRSRTNVYPLRPVSPVEITERQRIAILPFQALSDSNEISFYEGDLLTEIQQVDDQWIWAKLDRTGESGLVAVHLTLPLNDKRVRPEELPFFHDASLESLTDLLIASGAGSYLLRPSSRKQNSFALMLNGGKRIEKFFIRRTDLDTYELGGRFFPTITDIIDRYSHKEICEGSKLVTAVLRDIEKYARKPLNSASSDLRHLISYSSCPHPTACSPAMRKQKDEKWKSCFVMLSDASGSQLYIFDSEKHAKPKFVFDLCFCFVYRIDEIVLEKANCLYLVLNGLNDFFSVHLSFRTECIFLQWMCNLRNRCVGCRYTTSPFTMLSSCAPFIRSTTLIHLNLLSCRGTCLKLELEYSANVLINSVVVTRTRSYVPSAKNYVTFDARFFLEYIPVGSCSIQFLLYSHNISKGRVTKDNFCRESSAVYMLPDDGNEVCISSEGFMFRAVRHRIAVLPEDQYSSFFVLLTSHSFKLCLWIGSALNTFNRNNFSRSLLTIIVPSYSLLFAFLKVLLEDQLRSESESTLFRGDSFCVCCISNVLKMFGRDIAVEELSPRLQQLQLDKTSPIDFDKYIVSLDTLIFRLPPAFGAVLSFIGLASSRYFNDSPNIARRAVSAFFILRFINPILTFWNSNGGPTRQLAKSIQMTANQACAVDDTDSCSETVRSMVALLDSFVKSPEVDDGTPNPFNGFSRSGHLAVLAFHMEKFLDQKAEECPLPEALVVIRLLKTHAERYLMKS